MNNGLMDLLQALDLLKISDFELYACEDRQMEEQ